MKNSPPIVWAAWGGNIHKRNYLKQCLFDIHEKLNIFNCQWVTIEDKKYKNPHHPLYLSKSSIVQNFDIQSYINEL